jgi:tRNA pseudouridine55 synthase
MASDGFLLVDKPGGWTSHDVVAKIRNLAGTRKVGHAGTLDPMATGLLVVGLGRATRLLRFVQDRAKAYVASARFGVATDTLDAEGVETARVPMAVTRADVTAALDAFRGVITQVPPMTSAVKVGGRKLYEIAREGREIDRPPRQVTIHQLELLGFEAGEYPLVEFRTVCSSGTYVRSLADDLAASLGGRAHLTALRRTHVGSLSVEEATPLVACVEEPGRIGRDLLPLAAGLSDLPQMQVSTDVAERVAHGAKLPLADLPVASSTAVLDADGRLLAVYRPGDAVARAEVVVA